MSNQSKNTSEVYKDTALIDGDELLYKAGFAAQKTYYTIHRGEGSPPFIDFDFPGKQYALDFLPELPLLHLENVTRLKDYYNYEEYVDNKIKDYLKNTHKNKYIIFFAEGRNYRLDIAKNNPYKGNRDDSRKPILFEEIKEYILSKHNTHIVQDIEVDDALGLYHNETNVICVTDKDLNGVPGWRYGGKGPGGLGEGLRYISREMSILFFYAQLISGDPTDNIKGLHSYGLIKAYKHYIKVLGSGPYKEKDLCLCALRLYEKALRDPDGLGRNLDPERTAERNMLEIGQLLWMQRVGRTEFKLIL